MRNSAYSSELLAYPQQPTLNPYLPDPDDYASGASALHEQIIGSFCHDLRQPLNAALMRLASLQRAYTSGADRELLEELHQNLREIASMSETVFDAIRLSRASIRPSPVAVSVADLLERIRGEFAPLAKSKGLRLTITPAPYIVVSDEMLLGRILSNLVHNALHYTREGGILVAARRVGGEFSLEVWDTGPGIVAEEIEKIFTSFYRGSDARGRPHATSNAGVGLWNCREFARLLGGTLTVASRPGRGSVFRLRLPVAVEALPRRAERFVQKSGAGRSRIALLASDQDVLLEQQHLVLARGDAHVSFSDPLQLLAYLNVPLNRPDALLIDSRVGPVAADFLVGILAVRYPQLPLAVVADEAADALAETVHRLGVRILRKPLGADDLDAFLREVGAVALRREPSAVGLQGELDAQFQAALDARSRSVAKNPPTPEAAHSKKPAVEPVAVSPPRTKRTVKAKARTQPIT